MKRCPSCNRTYADDNQKFCTLDGGRLVTEMQGTMTLNDYEMNFDPNATVRTELSELDVPPPQQPVPSYTPDLNSTLADSPPQTSTIRRQETGPTGLHTTPPAPVSQQTQTTPSPDPEEQDISAPLQDLAQTSQPLPPPPQTPVPASDFGATVANEPLAPSFPQPQAPVQPSSSLEQPAQAAAAAQPARKSRMGLILGLIGGFLVLAIAIAAVLFFTVIKPRFLANANTNVNQNTNTGPNTNANANESGGANANGNPGGNINVGSDTVLNAPPVAPPPGSARFVNSSASLDGKLAEHYTDFSFYYPQGWTKDPKSGISGASNFVKVERLKPPDITQENFAVGWYQSSGTFEGDQERFPKLVEILNSTFAKNSQSFPEYRKVSEGETSIGLYKGYEFRFESVVRNTANGDVKQWGRVVFLPPGGTGEKNGVTLLMLATSLAPELASADDVGTKGELPMILETFRFGKEQ
ncbi:MAG TPA: hypothetical protein VGB17_01725 [Pyrinomonadaceae bacterium]